MPRTDETGRLAPNAARLRKIKDVTSTTKKNLDRERQIEYIVFVIVKAFYCRFFLISRLP